MIAAGRNWDRFCYGRRRSRWGDDRRRGRHDLRGGLERRLDLANSLRWIHGNIGCVRFSTADRQGSGRCQEKS
jgi:hypothetical protein